MYPIPMFVPIKKTDDNENGLTTYGPAIVIGGLSGLPLFYVLVHFARFVYFMLTGNWLEV